MLGLLGCTTVPTAAPPPYQAPAAGAPAARLLLRAAAPANSRMMLVLLEDSDACQSPKRLAQGLAGEALSAVRISAGQLSTLDFVLERPGQTACFVRWSFTPEADKTYLVQGLVVGAGCTARLIDTTRADRPQPPADLLIRSAKGQRCLPLATSQRATGSLIQGGQHKGEAVLRPDASSKDLEGLITP